MNTKLRLIGFLSASAIALSGIYFLIERKDEILNTGSLNSDQKIWQNTILEFRAEAEKRLRGPEGWLTVVGLTWLKPGENSIGSDASNAIVLPASAPKKLGSIFFSTEKTELQSPASAGSARAAWPSDLRIDGQPVSQIEKFELKSDGNGESKPTKVELGSVSFFLIKRKNGIGVRMRDQNSEARQKFEGRHWFEPDPRFVINAEWVPFDNPKPFVVPDILGNMNEEKSPGYARFELDGQKYELHPTVDDDGTLFFVFRDGTAGRETYGAARFLNTPPPKDGRVTLDFNRAVNPPCAFTHYATCPLPVPENVIKASIRAGELKPPGSDH
jgi:uncharacterized protein (DUF1684 family)